MHIFKFAAALGVIGGLMAPAIAAPVTTQCGKSIRTAVKTEIELFTTNSEIPPVAIPGTGVGFSVPAGASRCVRVRFSAVASCPASCFLRAFVDADQLNPAWVVNPLRFSTDNTNAGAAHSFEWAGRVGPGNHFTRIDIQVGSVTEDANIGPYTTSVEIMQ